MTRRWFVKSLLCGGIAAAGYLAVSLPVEARGRRVRFGGRGITARGHYSGSVLSQEQLKSCLVREKQINALSEEVDRDEAYLAEQERLVDLYSQTSVDAFNKKAHHYNSKVQQLKSSIDTCNNLCADKAYYESDMQAARNALGYK